MTTENIPAIAAPSFNHVLDQLTLAFEPYTTVAEVLAALDRANACGAPEVKETAITPLWEEPVWTDAELLKMERRAVEEYGADACQVIELTVEPDRVVEFPSNRIPMRAWAKAWRAELRMFGRDSEFAGLCISCACGWRDATPACQYTQNSGKMDK